jgi:hypothetical protein
MIDRCRKLLFVHITRTGGTSIETALVGRDWWYIEPATKHLSAAQTRMKYGEQVWRAFTTFTVVRNPWDRVVSMWATGWWHRTEPAPGARRPERFRDFVLDLKPHQSERYASLHYHRIIDEPLDFVLRFERLREDFSAMLRAIGQPDVRLPHVEKRERRHYRTYYDAETAALVGRLFEADIRRYNYTFGPSTAVPSVLPEHGLCALAGR